MSKCRLGGMRMGKGSFVKVPLLIGRCFQGEQPPDRGVAGRGHDGQFPVQDPALPRLAALALLQHLQHREQRHGR